MKKLATPITLGVIVLIFVLLSLFFVLRSGTQESLTLSISSAQNTANALSAVNTVGTTPEIENAAGVPIPEDAISALRGIPQASTFVSLLEETGVASQLSPTGTYTFFVPTNVAFASSPLGPLADMSAAQRLRLAEFHIVSGKMMSIDAVKAGYITMLSRDELNADVLDTAQVGANTHIIASYPAPDGIIYLIDIVLQPPTIPPFPY